MSSYTVGCRTVQIDEVGERQWDEIVGSFDDGSIYQTWPWGAVRWGERNLSHIVIRNGGEVKAAAQCWVLTVPLIRRGIAYVKHGPMWQRSGAAADYGAYLSILEAMKREYALKRGLLLRVTPCLCNEKEDEPFSTLSAAGFCRSAGMSRYRTLMLDLWYPEAVLRQALSCKWRNQLKRAAGHTFHIEEGSGDELLRYFDDIYQDTRNRKGFRDGVGITEIRHINSLLPEKQKFRIVLCSAGGERVSGHVVAQAGKTATVLFSGNTRKGLELRGSYFSNWHLVRKLKADGVRWLDLGGIDPERCPGTYRYKKGLAGRLGKDLVYESYDYCSDALSRSITFAADRIRNIVVNRPSGARSILHALSG